ncbi:CRISPR-associated helicase/endonuclease Cas3 [Wenjunlia tyrosinilytica]|uniref:CRISPR-associated helicase/endonuclease Cas3 n=2 Tax=Wenjunlia tyrosinilytica TaxID=1544741 RepID=A0A918DZN9_9ACTN|nr:CRISPR-associated helicase/endonuclease Cas3 [Wenjunlia tyrosinilytica]
MIGNTNQRAIVWGERHEVLSLGFVDLLLTGVPPQERLWVAAAVAGHHRAFTCGLELPRRPPLFNQYGQDQAEDFTAKFSPADQTRLNDLVKWLRATARRLHLLLHPPRRPITVAELAEAAHRLFTALMDRWETSLPPDDPDGTTAVLLLGAVTMADHLSSAHSPLATTNPLTADYPSRLTSALATKGSVLRPQQQQAAETTGNLLLRSWTGSGKTEAALLWALRQIQDLKERTGGNARVFYLLPYLASINAMTDRLDEALGTTDGIGVAHSKAASYHLARSLADGCPGDGTVDATGTQNRAAAAGKARARARAEATKNFKELLRIGTPYQLLRGALAGPVHSSILTDTANSVLVLDELHAYDPRRLGMILAMTRFWHRIGGRVAVTSATMPRALEKLVSQALEGQVTLVEAPPGTWAPVRHRLHIRRSHLTDDPSRAEIRDHLGSGRSVLVVANNVRDAISLYEDLRPFCGRAHGEDSAYLLHSRYRRMDRTAIETGIVDRFAAGKPRRPGLLVGTQALEVSLDLDLDVCHTSAADLEPLIQRFGRINRLAALPPAPVAVHQPAYVTRRSSGGTLWADGVYEAEPTQLAWDILTRHDGQTISESTVTEWLDEIYRSPWGQHWEQQVAHHGASFEDAFLNFTLPFDDRSDLTRRFDEHFNGTEAILATDRDQYQQTLQHGPDRATGRLDADQYLIPLPAWSKAQSHYDTSLQVRIIDADYDPHFGLLAIRREPRQTYRPGEVL